MPTLTALSTGHALRMGPRVVPVRDRAFGDVRGVPITARDVAAVGAMEAVTLAFVGHRRETPALIERALALDPELVPALCLRGFGYRFLGRDDLLPAAREAHRAAERSLIERGGCDRERLLVLALGAWCRRDPGACLRALEAIVAMHPRDLMSIKLLHGLLFLLGRSMPMRRVVEETAKAWHASTPGYGYVLGCLAFAREETGDHAAAERTGRRAVELEPRDAWGGHAVLHVMEMEDRPDEGLAWLTEHAPSWSGCNNFAGHLAWHRALFHVARGEQDAALALYDSDIASQPEGDYRDVANAASLLHRLEREGVRTGDRWGRLAERALVRAHDHGSVFAAVHYAFVLAMSGRAQEAHRMVRSMTAHACSTSGIDAELMAEVGVPLVRAIAAIGERRPDIAAQALHRLRRSIARLGGSRAQRDLFEVLTIEAAIDGGDAALAAELLDERLRARPRNAWALARSRR